MVDTVVAKIEGLAELETALRQLAPVAAKRALRSGMRQGANVIRNRAKELAPVSVRVPTGKRAKKYGWKPGFLKRAIGVRPKNPPPGASLAMEVYIGKKAFYGRFVEFGTSKMAAQPYLRPAADEEKETAIKVMAAVTTAQIVTEMLKATLK